jgi:mRNA-degrading endonuclease toxin of MazEF toxin-antitoxin module
VPEPGDVLEKEAEQWVVVSSLSYNRSGKLLACPVHVKVHASLFEVLVPEYEPVWGLVVTDKIMNKSWERENITRVGKLSPYTHSRVRATLRALIDPD